MTSRRSGRSSQRTHKEDSPKTALLVASSVSAKRWLRGLLDRRKQRLQHRRVLLVAGGEHFPVIVLGQFAALAVEGNAAARRVDSIEWLVVLSFELEPIGA